MENVSKESILKAVKPLREMLKDTTNKFGTKTALQERSGDNFVKYSYNKLDKYVTNLAKMLIKLGVKKGDKISVISKNRPEWTISYLAIHMSGAIVVPLDPLLKEGELFNIIKKANVKIVFCSGDYMFLMNGIKGKLDTLERIISMDEDHDEVDIHTMISEGKKLDINPFDVPVTNNDLMVLLFTSGTTGKSKGVMLTNENVIYDVLATVDRVVFDENDTFISILPLHHVFEATVGFVGALVQGSTIMYARGYRPSEIIEDIQDSKATIMLGVPLLFEKIALGILKAIDKQPFGVKAILKSAYGFVGVMRSFSNANLGKPIFKGLREKSGLSSIRLMVSGGATLKDWVSHTFERLGFPIIQGYGLSEASPVTNVNPLNAANNCSIGPPLVGMEMKIVNPNSEGVGEIAIKGPNVMLGYYEDKEETIKVLRDGWLYTGDIGYIDNKGYFYIKGRQKNVIVTEAGKNIYPEEIEEELMKSPMIQEVVVMSKRNERTGREEVHAVIYPNLEYNSFYEGKDGQIAANIALEEVGKIIKDEVKSLTNNLATYKRVRSISLQLKEFEKTTTKKIKRHITNEKKKN